MFKIAAPILFVLIILLIASCRDERIVECPCYDNPQHPRYKGCGNVSYDMDNDSCSTSKLYKQLYDALVYPQAARDAGVEGRVTITFDIFQDGSLGNFAIAQDTLGYGLGEAALEAVKSFGEAGFCPAMENCEPVIFHYTFPVLFVLPG